MRSRAIEAYKTTLRLSDVQREILVGILLGDACLETQNAGRSYRLRSSRASRMRTTSSTFTRCSATGC